MEIKNEFLREYNNELNSVHSRIINAIMDYYYLLAIDEIKNSINLTQLTQNVLRNPISFLDTIVFSLQKDFCLIVWCICCDSHSEANTIDKFKGKLNSKYLDAKKTFSRKPDTTTPLFTALKGARKKFIAHNDFDSSFGTIDLCELFDEFSKFFSYFNEMLVGDLIYEKYNINEDTLLKLKKSCEEGTKQLFDGTLYKFKNLLKDNK